MWPLLTREDKELTLPFKPHRDAPGFIFFDAGMVIVDLDWDLFEEKISRQFLPSCFSVENFRTALQETGLVKKWESGHMGPHQFVTGFYNCLRAAQTKPGSLLMKIPDLPAIKSISSSILGAARPRVIEIAKRLKSHRYYTGILSNATPWHESDLLEKASLREHFDLVLFSQDLGCAKPETEIYLKADNLARQFYSRVQDATRHSGSLDSSQKSPNIECAELPIYFLDDTPANVRSGASFGWQTRLVDTLRDPEHWKSPHLKELAQKRENLVFGEDAAKRIENLFVHFFEQKASVEFEPITKGHTS